MTCQVILIYRTLQEINLVVHSFHYQAEQVKTGQNSNYILTVGIYTTVIKQYIKMAL